MGFLWLREWFVSLNSVQVKSICLHLKSARVLFTIRGFLGYDPSDCFVGDFCRMRWNSPLKAVIMLRLDLDIYMESDSSHLTFLIFFPLKSKTYLKIWEVSSQDFPFLWKSFDNLFFFMRAKPLCRPCSILSWGVLMNIWISVFSLRSLIMVIPLLCFLLVSVLAYGCNA